MHVLQQFGVSKYYFFEKNNQAIFMDYECWKHFWLQKYKESGKWLEEYSCKRMVPQSTRATLSHWPVTVGSSF
jgi:hypothetical protein